MNQLLSVPHKLVLIVVSLITLDGRNYVCVCFAVTILLLWLSLAVTIFLFVILFCRVFCLELLHPGTKNHKHTSSQSSQSVSARVTQAATTICSTVGLPWEIGTISSISSTKDAL